MRSGWQAWALLDENRRAVGDRSSVRDRSGKRQALEEQRDRSVYVALNERHVGQCAEDDRAVALTPEVTKEAEGLFEDHARAFVLAHAQELQAQIPERQGETQGVALALAASGLPRSRSRHDRMPAAATLPPPYSRGSRRR